MNRESLVRGCLLGLAVGDAMGHPIDKKSWNEIAECYGPNGLLGYDLMDGGADVTSYTQLAAYTCNAMLLGACRGHQDRYIQYIARGLREWGKGQQYRGITEKTLCWVAQVPQLRRRLCMDPQLTDALRKETLGTPEKPVTYNDGPAMLTIAVATALLYDSAKQTPRQLRRLAMEAVALMTGGHFCPALLSPPPSPPFCRNPPYPLPDTTVPPAKPFGSSSVKICRKPRSSSTGSNMPWS